MEKEIYNLPDEFIQRIKLIYPREHVSILRSFLKRKDTSFRVNLVKNSSRELMDKCKAENILFKRVDWNKQAFLLRKIKQKDFQKSNIYKDGCLYLQNLSSMVPVMVLNPQPGEIILDLCSAPGSKTTQIVSQTQSKAEVVAVEKVKPRMYKLVANLKKQGHFDFVKVKFTDGTRIWKRYKDTFDKVLVDAPCSSEANFNVNNPKSYKYWSYRKIKESQYKQKKLLFSGISSLKKGGKLVYSTCTFAPEENEEIIDWAINKFSDEISLKDFKIPIPNIKNGLLEWKDKKFAQELTCTKRILPTQSMEGFFIALFEKKG